jgi:hypothetical protein
MEPGFASRTAPTTENGTKTIPNNGCRLDRR